VNSRGEPAGYRSLGVSDPELRRWLNDIASAPDDRLRLRLFKNVQEIFARVEEANEGGDLGMGLEFGLSLFAHGSHYFHKMILKTLPKTYEMLDRRLYGEIVRAHLADRRKNLCDRVDVVTSNDIGPQVAVQAVEFQTKPNQPSLTRQCPTDPNVINNSDKPKTGGAADWS